MVLHTVYCNLLRCDVIIVDVTFVLCHVPMKSEVFKNMHCLYKRI